MQDNSGFPKTMANWPPQFDSWLEQMFLEFGMLGRWMSSWRWHGDWKYLKIKALLMRLRLKSLEREIEIKEIEEAAGKSWFFQFTKKEQFEEKSMSPGPPSCPQPLGHWKHFWNCLCWVCRVWCVWCVWMQCWQYDMLLFVPGAQGAKATKVICTLS